MRTSLSPPAPTTLFMLAALPPLTLNMIVPSLTNIAADLKADYAAVSLALGGYLAVTALAELAIGPVADRIGRRPVLLSALTLFTIGSAGCALAQSVTMLLGFRMLQAGAIAGFVLSLAFLLLQGALNPALAHGVAEGDKGYIQEISGPNLIPFLYLGAKHMVTGYDHLLFLFGVIFFLYRMKDISIYVTLFAIGH